ncbi:MAG: SIS domain-containing protein [Patescibacteria group bacterium]|nr:SIS domain-containing protein [Patescibacteria group bacterium]
MKDNDVFKTFENNHKQFEQIFKEFSVSNLKSKLGQIDKIFVCGMGGSALGPHFVRSVFLEKINIPIIISNEYNLPNWVDKKTLIIILSFSGETEESISCFKEAQKKNFKTFIICTGGDLSKEDSLKFVYNPKYNYAKNPRFALGYSIAIFMTLLNKLGFLKYNKKDTLKQIKIFSRGKSQSKRLAQKIVGKIPIIISSEHLFGNAHIFNNQINETGKNFASYFAIPEICHHQFEGLTFPKNLNNQIVYILIISDLYHKRNQKRYEIMRQILNKKKIKFIEIKATGNNIFEEAIYVLGISSYVSFYLANYNKIDPQPNPWVDYLKMKINS